MKTLGLGGFTIIEVILFLAITGLILIIAITSIGSRNQEVQFTDGVRATEIYFERLYDNIRNGSIDNKTGCYYNETVGRLEFGDPSTIVNDGDCIFLGYIFELPDYGLNSFGDPQNSQITAHQVVGRRTNTAYLDLCTNSGEIYCAQPTLSGISQTFEIPWGIEVHGAFNSKNIFWSTYGFAFIRKPSSTSIINTTFITSEGSNKAASPNFTVPAILLSLLDKSVVTDDQGGTRASLIEEESDATHICLRSGDGDQFAAITVSGGFREESVELSFESNDDYPADCLLRYGP